MGGGAIKRIMGGGCQKKIDWRREAKAVNKMMGDFGDIKIAGRWKVEARRQNPDTATPGNILLTLG